MHTNPRSFVALMYHNLVDAAEPYAGLSPSITRYFVSRASFVQQMQTIAELARCCGPDDLAPSCGQAVLNNDEDRQPRVMLTFDDGWRGSVEIGRPILESFGYRAFLFVTTDFVGARHFFSCSELREASQSVFCVGSHGRTHRLLSRLTDAEIRHELGDSKTFLEDTIGKPVHALSIPGGAYDPRVTRLAHEIGYKYVFSSDVCVNCAEDTVQTMGRVAIKSTTTLPAFRRYVCHRLARERLREWLLRVPKRWLGAARYERVRRQLLGETAGQIDMQDLRSLTKDSPVHR